MQQVRTGPSQADLAAGLGVSQPMVSKLKARGMPTFSVAAAQAWRAANLNQAHRRGRMGPVTDPAGTVREVSDVESFNEARRRREIAEANTAELKFGELRGELVRRSEVKAVWDRKNAADREAMLQIPLRVSAQLAACSDQAEVASILEAEIRAALSASVLGEVSE